MNLINSNIYDGFTPLPEDNSWVGVRTSIDKFVKEQGLSLEIMENNFWIIRK